LKPFDGFFSLTFWNGDKAVASVERSKIPDKMKQDLIHSKRYMIGRSLTIEKKKPEDTEYIMDLIGFNLITNQLSETA